MGIANCCLLPRGYNLASCKITDRIKRIVSQYSSSNYWMLTQCMSLQTQQFICLFFLGYFLSAFRRIWTGNSLWFGSDNQSGVAQIKVFAINSEEKNILEYINNEKANILVRPSLTTEAIKIIANYV